MDVRRGFILLMLLLPFLGYASVPATSIYQQYHHFTDNTHSFQLDEIPQARETVWLPLENMTPNFSLSSATHWIRVQLHNPGKEPFKGYFAIKTPHQDYISALIVDNQGRKRQIVTGDRTEHNTRPVKHRHFHFPVELAESETNTLYFQLRSHDGFFEIMPLELICEESWSSRSLTESMLFGLYYGAAGILMFYNLALFISTRDRRFASYTLYLFSFTCWNLSFTGYAFEFLWPESPKWNNQFLALSTILTFWCFSLLGIHFMNLKQTAKTLYRVVVGINAVLLLPFAMTVLDHYAAAFTITFAVITILFLAIMGVSAWLALKGLRVAQIFFAAWLVLTASAMIYIAQLMNVLPPSPYAAMAVNIGSLIEFLILAIALAVHFNQTQLDSIAYHTKLAEQNTEYNQQLQIIVQERTAQLDQAHNRLADIAMTDPLTGLLNRRHFSNQLERQLKRVLAPDELLSLILIDIDNFRGFNDKYGHAAGDSALASFAKLLKENFQGEREKIFRVGGEEFAILFKTDSRAKIQSRLAALRISSEQGNINLPDQSGNPLNYSTGVAVVANTEQMPSSSSLFRLADEALYTAKSSYRSEPVIREWDPRQIEPKSRFAEV